MFGTNIPSLAPFVGHGHSSSTNKVNGICSHGTLKYMIEKYGIDIGEPAVNILCFRSENSVQYGGNYKFRCELDWLYDILSDKGNGTQHVKEIENKKQRILQF